jgi:hypothetical protein
MSRRDSWSAGSVGVSRRTTDSPAPERASCGWGWVTTDAVPSRCGTGQLCELPTYLPGTDGLTWTHDMSHLIQQKEGKPPNRVFDMKTGDPSDAYARFRDVPRLPSFSWDGKRYYLPNADGSVYTFHDSATHKQIASFDLRARGIGDASGGHSGDLRLWAAAGKERDAVHVWDIATGRRVATLQFPVNVELPVLSLSHDGRTVLAAVAPDSLYVFRLPDPSAARDRP